MGFQPARLLPLLRGLAPCRTLWVAFSGGADSSALLHALHSVRDELPAPLRAVHVDHGLHPDSPVWHAHCRSLCETLAIPFEACQVDAYPGPGESPEAAARRARYGALTACLGPGDVLLTAHHRDDQGETLLLQLLRGGGPRGLAAMPHCMPFAAGRLCRPLLDVPRQALLEYARGQGLSWIDDPSNFDTDLDRNFLRRRLLPLLQERWPAVGRVLARSAGHFADAAGLLDELAAQDLEGCVAGEGTLAVGALRALSPRRCRNLLRYWFRRRGLAVPDSRHLQRIVNEVLTAAPDGTPLVSWPGVEVRRYRDRLYAMAPLPAVSGQALPWDLRADLALPGGLGTLEAQEVRGAGLHLACRGQSVEVRFRRGGERCHLPGRAHSHSLKKLLQGAELPPWLRTRLPLVYVNGELAAVADLWICEPYAAGPGDLGILPQWDAAAIETKPQKQDN